MEKEDLNTNYGTDLDDASYVMEVVCVMVFIFKATNIYYAIVDVRNNQ